MTGTSKMETSNVSHTSAPRLNTNRTRSNTSASDNPSTMGPPARAEYSFSCMWSGFSWFMNTPP